MGKSGLATAVATLGGMGDVCDAGDFTPDMFEPEGVQMPLSRAAVGKSTPKGGRPAGARNKSTEEWRRYLLSRYPSPLVGLIEVYTRAPADLARELGLYMQAEVLRENEHGRIVREVLADESRPDIAAAFKIQMEALQAALPYLHQKQPLAIEPKGGAQLGILMMGEFPSDMHGDGIPFAPEQNQRVIDHEADQSHDQKSHGDE
jgi:hypothetical protein